MESDKEPVQEQEREILFDLFIILNIGVAVSLFCLTIAGGSKTTLGLGAFLPFAGILFTMTLALIKVKRCNIWKIGLFIAGSIYFLPSIPGCAIVMKYYQDIWLYEESKLKAWAPLVIILAASLFFAIYRPGKECIEQEEKVEDNCNNK